MAKRRRGGRGYYSKGQYRFTARRQAQLKRAQAISARRRKGKSVNRYATAAKVGGVLAGAAVAGYLGTKHRGTISRTASNWKSNFSPQKKEQTRKDEAISPGLGATRTGKVRLNPKTGQPYSVTHVPQVSDEAIEAIRGKLVTDKLGPQLGGPDHRIYDEEGNVDTDAMTARSVKKSTRPKKGTRRRKTNVATESATKAGVLGRRTGSLKGTPGGTKMYSPANPSNKIDKNDIDAAFWMESQEPYQPASETGMTRRRINLKDPPKAPTSGTNTTKDAKPKLSGEDREAAINAAMNANPFVTREEVIERLKL